MTWFSQIIVFSNENYKFHSPVDYILSHPINVNVAGTMGILGDDRSYIVILVNEKECLYS